ncbi:MAG: hypothetical protein H8E03_01000 [Pelagibacteraceae bacterium]|nr:hypothetical protein [Pelagibacteraceae bacterium]
MPKFIKDSTKKVIYGNDGPPERNDKTSITHLSDSIIDKMEREYPEMMTEFRRIQEEQYELFAMKQHDYGPGNISMGTSLVDEADIKLSLTALVVRVNDKVNRLVNLIIKRNSEGQAEPTMDAFKDISVYGIIAQIVKNGKWGK